jgi:hypothetical protein
MAAPDAGAVELEPVRDEREVVVLGRGEAAHGQVLGDLREVVDGGHAWLGAHRIGLSS